MATPTFSSELNRTIKNRELEEGYDLWFSRPLGYVLARGLSALHFSPNAISILGLIVGITGGVMMYWQDALIFTATGGALITLAGLLDSADGQAARLYGTGSELGRYLDAIIDNVVFITAYAAGMVYLVPIYSIPGAFALSALAGASHSIKSCVYEFYKGEFLHFSGTDSKFRILEVDEIRKTFPQQTLFEKFIAVVVIDYMRKQKFFKFRSDEMMARFEQAQASDMERFREIYRRESRPLITQWAWVAGSNVMRNGIIIASLFGRFDLYLFANIASYGLFMWVGRRQNAADARILAEFEATGKQ